MIMQISFLVPGNPVAKGRPKFARRGNYVQTYSPEKTASYENLVKLAAQKAMNGQGLFDSPVSVDIWLYVQVPGSWSNKKKQAALSHIVLPATKPDADNCIKSLFDAINGIVWHDDKQVTDLRVVKRYSDAPRAVVQISAIDNCS